MKARSAAYCCRECDGRRLCQNILRVSPNFHRGRRNLGGGGSTLGYAYFIYDLLCFASLFFTFLSPSFATKYCRCNRTFGDLATHCVISISSAYVMQPHDSLIIQCYPISRSYNNSLAHIHYFQWNPPPPKTDLYA